MSDASTTTLRSPWRLFSVSSAIPSSSEGTRRYRAVRLAGAPVRSLMVWSFETAAERLFFVKAPPCWFPLVVENRSAPSNFTVPAVKLSWNISSRESFTARGA